MKVMEKMIGQCRLCEQSKEILESHILPAFVIRWTKKTGTGYFRYVKNPNQRAQDGPKDNWLCAECEQRFSTNEDYFASNIFYPFAATDEFSFNYDESLIYFLVSLLWRSLHRDLQFDDRSNDQFIGEIRAAELEWRHYLLRQGDLNRFAHVHLFMPSLGIENPPGLSNFNVYCTRAIDGVTITDAKPRFIFSKFSRFMVVGMLSPYDEHKWCGTRVKNGTGEMVSGQQIQEMEFGKFLCMRAHLLQKIEEGLSARQKVVITAHVSKNMPKILASEFGKAMLMDLSNKLRYESCKGKIQPNEPCPCGNGFRFGDCHGRMI